MEEDFLEEFIVLETRDESSRLGNEKFLCFLSSVFRATNTSDHAQFFQKDPPTMEILMELCICTISTVLDMTETKWNAAEVLYALTTHQQTLTAVRKACFLYPMEISDAESAIGSERLVAVSEMLLQCDGEVSDLALVLALVLKICESEHSIAILICARNSSDGWPMLDVLVDVLNSCIGDVTRLTSTNYLRPIALATSNPGEFLPFHLQSEPQTQVTVLALRLVHRCVANQVFAQSLETEIDLLRNLLTCLATAHWEVPSISAVALYTLIRCNPDWWEPDDGAADVVRYICDQGFYRHLEFFSTIDTHGMFRLSPSSHFPPYFVLLVRWLRFYSVNLTLLSGEEVVGDRFELEKLAIDSQKTKQRDQHEKLVESILGLLLYIVANFRSVVYNNDNGEVEKSERLLFLHSLLTFCQRKSLSSTGLPFGYDGSTCFVSNSRIRSRALELVQLLCSIELPHISSIEVFTNARQMEMLMMIVERSTSDIEKHAAVQLMGALALNDTIKTLLVGTTSLISRLGAWLEIDTLQLLAAVIFQRLATPSRTDITQSTSNSVFGFSPSVQQQLAQFLFVGVKQLTENRIHRKVAFKKSVPLLQIIRRMRISAHLKVPFKCTPRQGSTNNSVSLRLKFEIVDQNGQIIRGFEYHATLDEDNGSSQHEFLAEPTGSIVRCTSFACGNGNLAESKLEFSRGFGSTVHHTTQDNDSLSLEFFAALADIVAEFCKDYNVFIDPVVDLPSQILIVLGISVNVSPVGRMDVSCLKSLVSWFPSNQTISAAKSCIVPLLKLIQGVCRLSCVNKSTKQLQLMESEDPNAASFSFLERLVELIGSVESHDLTVNALNVLFIENADVLLYLCAQINSDQSPHATFLSLVGIAIRRKGLHCQIFLASNTQLLLRSVFDAGIQECAAQSEVQQCSLLHHASLVSMRLARCPIATHDTFNCTRGLELLSRVAFEVFARHPRIECFPTDAAENLILAYGFSCDGLLRSVTVEADTSYAALLAASSVQDDGLTFAETLLMFLGRTSSNGGIEGHITYDSYDRLAATILASLVEKLPSHASFEQSMLQLLDERSHNIDKTLGKTFEEQCLTGVKKCLRLTRYDFQSELNAIRLTYYLSIRAGVRTGIIPPQCSGVFQRFDKEHLVPTGSSQWHFSEQLLRRQSYIWHDSDDHISTSSNHLLSEDAKLDSELRELLSFTNEHTELLSVLTLNRKKALTTPIRIAAHNAQVLMAVHAMTSIALDFFIDTAKKLQLQKQATGKSAISEYLSRWLRRASAIPNLGNAEQTTFVEWLLLLEQFAGLLCCGLHELDATYYMEIARQFRLLILDLPMFLRKMNRVHSQQQALMLFLDNLHRILKRATNRNELRVVAANGSGIVDQTKIVRERLRQLDVHSSTSLGVLLDSQDGMEKVSGMLIAMQYMWTRIMGTTSLEKAMTSSKESRNLMKKLMEKLVRLLHGLRHPVTTFRTRHEHQSRHEFNNPTDIRSPPLVADSISTDHSSQSSNDHGGLVVDSGDLNNLSSFPFTSLELLLDHFGWESISAKRVKQLIQSSRTKNAAVMVLSSALNVKEDAVERMSVLELAERFRELEGAKKISDVLDQLRQLALEDEMPFSTIPIVEHDTAEMSLWRLMVRPIQRVRLYHFYQQVQRFVRSDPTKRRIVIEGYRQGSPQRQLTTVESRIKLGSNPESRKNLTPSAQRASLCSRLFNTSRNEQQVGVDRPVHGESVTPSTPTIGPWTASPTPKVAISRSTLKICDGIFNRDPFSDDAAMRHLRRKLKSEKQRHSNSIVARICGGQTESSRSAQYCYDEQDGAVDRMHRWVILLGTRVILLVAFWRKEELHTDLQDPIMARAFDTPHAKEEYYRIYHAKKGLGELVRVWMPTSGRLGLLL